MCLLGHRLALVAIADDDERNHTHHDHADDAGHHENRPLQIMDLLRVLTLGLPRVLGCVFRAASQHDG